MNTEICGGSLSKKIRFLREGCSMTQEDLANKLGLSRNYINQVENGRKIPSVQTIFKIAGFFKVNPGGLISEEDSIIALRSVINHEEAQHTADELRNYINTIK